LDFDRWRQRLISDGGFTYHEIEQLRDALRDISQSALARNKQDLAVIESLERRFAHLASSSAAPLEQVWTLLHDCRRYGALPFAHLARSAFVAVTFLRSAVSTGNLTDREMDDFLGTISTVSHTFTHDALSCSKGEISSEDFMQKYGHLRPGTYDINSLSYRAAPERYLIPIVKSATSQPSSPQVNGQLWQQARQRFTSALNEQGIACNSDELELFLREAIEGREYAKFAFTRNLSLALDALVDWAEPLGITREDLAYIEIHKLMALRNSTLSPQELTQSMLAHAAQGKIEHEQIQVIELPPLLCSAEDFNVFLYPATQPNFVGTGVVRSTCVDLSQSADEQDLVGKIAMIPQADPGYDWLFDQLGATSRAAIRKAIIEIISACPRVERAVLFGSRAMGTFTTTSDVDIALFGDSLSLDDQARLARKIDELPIPQRVDLLRYHTIRDKKLRAHIRKHGVEWFRRDKPGNTPVPPCINWKLTP
jgi:predicted nucleotidyltransferase